MGAQFAGAGRVAYGRLLGAFLLAGMFGVLYFAEREEPPPAAQPRQAAVFPAYRQVTDGSAVLRDPFAAPVSGRSESPAARGALPAASALAPERKAAKGGPVLPKLSGVASRGARQAAVFVWGKETKVCVAGDWIGPYRVAFLAADGAVLTGPDGALRLRVGR